MAGLLESIGRAKPVTQIRQGLMEFGEQQRERRIQDYQIGKLEAEEQRRAQPVNINLHPMFQALTPEGRKRVTEDLRSRGTINAEGVGDIGGLEDYVKEIETTSSLFESVMKPEVVAIEQQALALMDKLKEEQGKDKPNPKAIQQLQLQIQQATAKAAMSRGRYEKAWNIMKTEEEKLSFEAKEDIKQQHRVELERAKATVGRRRIGGTKEMLLATMASGKKLTLAQQQVWDTLDKDEKEKGTLALSMLKNDLTFQDADLETKAKMLADAMEIVEKTIYGEEAEVSKTLTYDPNTGQFK